MSCWQALAAVKVKKRASEIKIDAVLESGYIVEFIEDEPYDFTGPPAY